MSNTNCQYEISTNLKETHNLGRITFAMKTIFLDNFRGFQKSTISLLDVNFLVGENSSGKTSLLKVIQMLSDNSVGLGFNLKDTRNLPGHFSELVSAHSGDKSYFRLGVVDEVAGLPKRLRVTNGSLFTFEEVGGLPRITRVTIAIDNTHCHMAFDGKKIHYQIVQSGSSTDPSYLPQMFEEWTKVHQTSAKGWTEIELQGGIGFEEVPLMYVLMELSNQLPKDKTFNVMRVVAGSYGQSLVWIAPIRTKPLRTYDEPYTGFTSEGNHTPYVIRRMLGSQSEAQSFRDFMSRIGRTSGLFQRIEIKCFGDSSDVSAPFEVDAVLDDMALSISWLGYGVSQSLPIFVELLDRPKKSMFAIQQPEVHLHPRAQACLGDVFFEMAIRDEKRFLIETHSDFMIDRFRMNYQETPGGHGRAKLPDSQILFFERKDKFNTATSIKIGLDGNLPSDQPMGYRDFFVNEEIRMLGL